MRATSERGSGSAAGGVVGVTAIVVLACSVLEMLVVAPYAAIGSPRVWLLVSGASLLLIAILSMPAAGLWGLARALGARGVAPGAVALAVAGGLCAGVVVRRLAESLVGAPLLALPSGARPLVLGAGAGIGIAVAAWALHRRFGLGARALALPLGALLAIPTAISVALQGNGLTQPPHLRAYVAAGVLLFGAAIGAATIRGGRFRSLWVGGVAVAVAVAASLALPNQRDPFQAAPAPATRAGGPPIVLIVLDTLRADAVVRGDPDASPTPALARLAQQADVYTQAIANASWTLPGHASLFSGLTVGRHRIDLTAEPGFAPMVPAQVPLAAEILGANGYRTTCVVANGIVSFSSGLARGCQSYHNPSRSWLYSLLPLRVAVQVAGDTSPVSQLVLQLTGTNLNPTADEIVDSALGQVTPGGAGEYVFLNFLDVHTPLTLPPGDDRVPTAARRALVRDIVRWIVRSFRTETFVRRNLETLRAYYAAQTSVLDGQLARLFRGLERAGWWDPALVIVTADHGESWFDNPSQPGYFGHHSTWEPAVRIPLLVKRPGQREGRVFDNAVQQTAVLPTILQAAGLPAPEGLDDRPLDGTPRELVISEWYAARDPGVFPYFPGNRIAVYRDGRKYVREGDGRERLFDLEASPWEEVDVADREPDRLAALRDALDAARRDDARGSTVETNPELIEKLRNLGYVH